MGWDRQKEYETLIMNSKRCQDYEKVCLKHLECAERRAFVNDITRCLASCSKDTTDPELAKAVPALKRLAMCDKDGVREGQCLICGQWFNGKVECPKCKGSYPLSSKYKQFYDWVTFTVKRFPD